MRTTRGERELDSVKSKISSWERPRGGGGLGKQCMIWYVIW